MKKQEIPRPGLKTIHSGGYGPINSLGDPNFLMVFWFAAIAVVIFISAWWSKDNPEFLSDFLLNALALTLILLPTLSALTIAGLVAAKIQRAGWYGIALLTFTALVVGLAAAGTYLVQKSQFNLDVGAKEELFWAYARQMR